MLRDDIALLFPQPFEQRRHVDLIGLVIARHSIDYDVDPKPNRPLPLRFAPRYNRRYRIAPLVPCPRRSPIISTHDDGRNAIAAARRNRLGGRVFRINWRQGFDPKLTAAPAPRKFLEQVE